MIFPLKLYILVLIVVMINSGIYQVINKWFRLDLLQSYIYIFLIINLQS